MHAVDREMVFACIVQYALAQLTGCISIHVVGRTVFRMPQLERGTVDEIGDNE